MELSTGEMFLTRTPLSPVMMVTPLLSPVLPHPPYLADDDGAPLSPVTLHPTLPGS